MSPRIRELMEQATEPPVFPANIGYFNPEKFAELIIRECAEMMPHDNLYKMVLEHFGIDE